MTKSHLYLTNYERQKRPDDFVKHIPWTVLTRAVRGGVIDHVGCYFLQYLMTHHKNYTPTKEQSQDFMNMSKSSFRRLLQSLKEADLISIEKQVGRGDKIHLNPDFVQVIENALNLLQEQENKIDTLPVDLPDNEQAENTYIPVVEEESAATEEVLNLTHPSEVPEILTESSTKTESASVAKKEKLSVHQIIKGDEKGFPGMESLLWDCPIYKTQANGKKRNPIVFGMIPAECNENPKNVTIEDLLSLPEEEKKKKTFSLLTKLVTKMKTENCTGYDNRYGKVIHAVIWGQTQLIRSENCEEL